MKKICWSFFEGCEKGDWDESKCKPEAQQTACTYGHSGYNADTCKALEAELCKKDFCKMGGMAVGTGWFLFILGILAVAILGPLFCCGAMACCCCAGGGGDGKGKPPVAMNA